MKKYLLLTFLAFCAPFIVFSQASDRYIQLGDASGYTPTADQIYSLENASKKLCNLIDSSGYPGQFKVYDFGFYLHQENTIGGYPEPFGQKIQEALQQTPYYILFGKQTDNTGCYTRLWVDLKIPTGGPFACIESVSENLREDIEDKIKFLANGLTFSTEAYHIAEVTIIDSLNNILYSIFECCEYQNKKNTGEFCSSCIFSPIDVLYKIRSQSIVFPDIVIITDDPDYVNYQERDKNNLLETPELLNIRIKPSIEGESVDLDSIIEGYINQFKENFLERFYYEPSISKHLFKYPRDCSRLSLILDEYNISNARFKIFVGIVNFGNNSGVMTVSLLTGAGVEIGRMERLVVTNPILEDELEVVHEAANGQPCEDLISAYTSYLGASLASSYSYNAYLPAEEYAKIDNIFNSNIKSLSEAEYQFGIAWAKEYEIMLAYHFSHDDNGIDTEWWDKKRAKWSTTWHLCGDAIHTILDACGLIPVVGEACDGANTFLYLASSDLINATLSFGAMIPIAGYGAFGTKYAGKLWNAASTGASCVSGNRIDEADMSASYCRVLSFIVRSDGLIQWAGGRNKLKQLMNDSRDFMEWNINGVLRRFDPNIHEAHHIIPWEFLSPDNGKQKKLVQFAARKGWHASNPALNGFPVPKLIHTSGQYGHYYYNKYVKEKIEVIENMPNLSPDIANTKIRELVADLQNKINQAILQNKTLENYFKDL